MLFRRSLFILPRATPTLRVVRNARCENFTTLTMKAALPRGTLLTTGEPGMERPLHPRPIFPRRLTTSGHTTTMEFPRILFTEYAQAGLSEESEREAAISGLLRRIQRALGSACRFGVLECLISRLVLWRVADEADDPSPGDGGGGGA